MILFRVKISCLILLLALVSLISSYGQNSIKPISIKWENPKKILDSLGREITVLSFERGVYNGKDQYLPSYVFSIPGNVSDFKIINPVHEALTTEEQKIIPPSIRSLEPKIEVKYSKGNPISIISIIPLKGSFGGITDKIISFEYSYQRDFAAQTPTAHSNTRNAGNRKGLRLAASSTSSVLSSGDWYKISIPKSGIFKIDYNFLKSMGINPSSLNPEEIKIYGNGGGMLSQRNSDSRYDDLMENAIYVHEDPSGTPGVFDNTEYILFYGQGPDTWSYNSSEGIFNHTKNLYSDAAFYFITIGPGNGLRIQSQASIPGALQTITSFDERLFHENDHMNLLKSGREWYGELFDVTTQQTFSFFTPGIIPNTVLKLTSFVMGRSLSTSSFTLALNNQYIGTQNFLALGTYEYTIRGSDNREVFSVNTNSISGSTLNVKLTYNKGSYALAVGHLNYLEVNVKRDLKLYGNQTSFRSVQSIDQPISEFVLNDAGTETRIWDITDPLQPKNQAYTLSGTQATFATDTDILKEFVAFSGSAFEAPSFAGRVTNQNLHSINAPDLPDLIIVSYPGFLSAANRLAQFRKTKDNLDAVVVTTDQVYNEFSSGAQDITAIRDFAKMLYDRKSGTDSIRYLLLFGDGSYDYKNRISGNSNFVPIYESRNSLHPTQTYSSDDFFGFFDDYEGYWAESSADLDSVEIGIGRLPAKNLSEAETMVSKIIHYTNSVQCQGKWRNKVTFFADDGDSNIHLNHADDLSDIIKTNYRNYNIHKIFLDAYPQISSPGGETCPAAKEAITQAVEKGTLVLNYTGHGGELQLAQEVLVDINQINNWKNYNALTFFITATCAFGRYDDPSVVSGAEVSLLSNQGGAIALITSTRPVYAHTNEILNRATYNNLFIPVAGNMPRLGDVIRLTKNSWESVSSGVNNRNYALLGDPSMMLAYPKENVVITNMTKQINGSTVPLTDTLNALSTVTIEGEIQNGSGARINTFKGSVHLTIYDKEATIPTYGTQGSAPTSFKAMNNLIYEGPASVEDGTFKITFVVPKDISYLFDKGKISLYAKNDNSTLDASGYNVDIVIGGSDTSFTADNIPPQIKLFMDDESFVFGGLTGRNSLFLAKVSDDNGINIAGLGIGHEVTAILDSEKEPIVLNDYYTAKKDNYKEGTVEFPFKELEPGNHSVKFKCWDTHNNSSEAYLEFVVANDQKIALEHVLNYPNPFSTHTTFHFDHNRSGDDIDVMVQVYTISGKLIKTLDNRILSSSSHISDLSWDGRDDFGDKIGKGVYVYKVNVRSLRDASQVFKYQKLVILN